MKRAAWALVVLMFVGLGMWSGHSDGQRPGLAAVALAAPSCQCPEKQCANGTVAGCTVTCPAGQDAVCACDAFCDDGGNAGGRNKCECQ
jgi:hypothetical protein